MLMAERSAAQDTVKVKELTQRAETCVKAGKIYDAILIYRDILDLDANNYRSANAIAGLYGMLHQYADQISWAKQAITINPKYGLAYITVGNGYGASGEELKAEDWYRKADQLMPESPYPPYCIAVIQEKEGQARNAISNYQRCIDRDPNFADGYCGLAVCYAMIQEYDTAKKYIDQALVIDPKSARALEIKGRIADASKH